MKLISKSLFLLFCFTISSFPCLSQGFDDVQVKSEKLSESVYMLTGSGGNIGVSIGEDGVFMIDDQFAPLSEKIKAAIAKLSDQPINYVFNTHWHGDHTGGNENLNKDGAVLIAHDNVYERMSKDQLMKAFNRQVKASPEGALPEITLSKDLTFYLNGEKIYAFHVHNAHTDGDVIIYFTKSNVIHMGDTYFNGRYPFIDLSSKGSIDGVIAAANEVLFLIDDDTKIIPGHGEVSNKKELTTYRDVLMTIRDRVKKAIDAGMTLEEIQASNLSKDFDEKWGQNFIKPAVLIDIIYTDLSN